MDMHAHNMVKKCNGLQLAVWPTAAAMAAALGAGDGVGQQQSWLSQFSYLPTALRTASARVCAGMHRVTRHTSHITHHTSHVTHHTSTVSLCVQLAAQSDRCGAAAVLSDAGLFQVNPLPPSPPLPSLPSLPSFAGV
jgi:hypothetical protein